MIRVAVCARRKDGRVRARDAFERYAACANIRNIEVMQFRTPAELEEAVARMRHGYFDLCFCYIESTDSNSIADDLAKGAGIEALQEGHPEIGSLARVHEDDPGLRIIVASEDKALAMVAYDLEAGFLLSSANYDDFVRVVSGPLGEIAGARDAIVAVRSNNGVENVVLADIQFVESMKRGSVIHLPADRTLLVRVPLQKLFEALSGVELPDPGSQPAAGQPVRDIRGARLVKAGSSFIVNLDNVRSAGGGALVFADGETIIVPIRKRKAVLDALDSYQLRENRAD